MSRAVLAPGAPPGDETTTEEDVMSVTGHLVPDELHDPRTQRLKKTGAGAKGKQAEAAWIAVAQDVVRGNMAHLTSRQLTDVNVVVNRHINNMLEKCQFLAAATGATITFVHDPHPAWLERVGRAPPSVGREPASAFRPVFGVCTGSGRAEYAMTGSMGRGLRLVRDYINNQEQKKQGNKRPLTCEADLLAESENIRAELLELSTHWNTLVRRQQEINDELRSLRSLI